MTSSVLPSCSVRVTVVMEPFSPPSSFVQTMRDGEGCGVVLERAGTAGLDVASPFHERWCVHRDERPSGGRANRDDVRNNHRARVGVKTESGRLGRLRWLVSRIEIDSDREGRRRTHPQRTTTPVSLYRTMNVPREHLEDLRMSSHHLLNE